MPHEISGAPITTVSPRIAGRMPNRSYGSRSEAVSLAVSVMFTQPPGGFSKTYAEPLRPSSLVAPTTTVSAEMATDPNISPAAASEAVSLAVSVMSTQPAGGFTNT